MKMRMRVLALLLSATMVFSAAPMTAFAAEPGSDSEIVMDSETPIVDDEDSDDSDSSDKPAGDIDAPKEDPATEDPTEEPTDEEPSELEEQEIAPEAELNEAVTPVFEVGGDGSLALKSGATLPTDTDGVLDIAAYTEGTVTKIPDKFFTNYKYSTIIIPATVTSIGEGAFENNDHVETVEFAEGFAGTTLSKDLFSGCSKLIDSGAGNGFDIPKSVVTIGENCFNNCGRLNIVSFDANSDLTTIGKSAFANCGNLERLINLNKTKLTTISSLAFQGTAVSGSDLKFPNTALTIGASAFKGDKELGKLDFTTVSTLTIEKQAFAESGLRGISLPDSYNKITEDVFKKCTSLEEVTVGTDHPASENKGVTEICGNAFSECTALEYVKLKNSVQTIRNGAFSGCTKLSRVEIYQGKDLDEGSTVTLETDAFPIQSGLTLYGYSGNVEDWVGMHSADGILYKSLYQGLKLDVNDQYYGSSVSVSSPDKTIAIGSKVNVKPTAGKNYYLISVAHGNNKELCDSSNSFVIKGSDITTDEKTKQDTVKVNVAFASRDTVFRVENEMKGETKPLLKVEGNRTFKLTTSGEASQLHIKASDGNYGENYSNPWLWNFKSDNTDFITVDAEGNIKPVQNTKGTSGKYIPVTATLKADPSVVITVRVTIENTLTFGSIKDFEFESNRKMPVLEPLQGGNDLNKHVVTVSKSWLETAVKNKQTRDMAVTVKAIATEKDSKGQDLYIDSGYDWVSGNEKIVKLAKKSTSDCKNTIQICGIGETTITVTSKVKNSEDKYAKESFVVRVIDKTPYVSDTSIVLNKDTSATKPWTKFTMVKSHGGVYDTSKEPVIYAYEKNKWVEKKDFTAGYNSVDGEKQLIKLELNTESDFYKKNSSATNLYAKVLVDGEYVYVKLPKVSVVAKAPSPSIKLEGKINTFYKGGVAEVENEVSVKGTVAALTGYTIDSAPTLQALTTDADDEKFTDNFKITVDTNDYSKFVITQKASTLKTNSKTNKPVVTGYVYVPYVGGVTAKIKVTVPTTRTVPSYYLDKTTVFTHSSAQKQSFSVQLLDKKTKQVVPITASMAANPQGYGEKSSPAFWGEKPVLSASENTITVSMPTGLTSNCTAYIVVRDDKCWQTGELLTYPLSIRVNNSKPAPKMAQTTIVVNPLAGNGNQSTIELTDSFYAELKNVSMECTDKNARLAESDKILVKYTQNPGQASGVISATIKNTSDLPKDDTYTYKFTYDAEFINNTGDAEKTQTIENTLVFKVKVAKKEAKLKPKAATLTLNDYLFGVKNGTAAAEIATTVVTPENLPSNAVLTADLTGAKLVDVTERKVENQTTYTFDGSGKVAAASPIAVDITNGVLSVSLQKKLNLATRKFEIRDAKIGGIKIGTIAFSVKSINKEPVISFGTKGTINSLDNASYVACTLKIENFAGPIDASKLEIVKEDSSAGGSFEKVKGTIHSSETNLAHFVISNASGNTFNLMVRDHDDPKFVARKYKMQLTYIFGKDSSDKFVHYGESNKKSIIETTPKQVMPALKQSANEVTLYSTNKAYKQSIIIEQKVANANIVINSVKLDDKANKAELVEAFGDPTYDAGTGKVTISIKDASLLTKDKDYTLTYYIECDNQLKETKGTTFKVKVKVK